jgi:predicted TIM-barrel fold metal-dependent hydrolase
MIRSDEHRSVSNRILHCDTGLYSPVMSRRSFVAGATSLGALAASGIGLVPHALGQAAPQRIDVHHHISPPSWIDAVKKAKLDNPPINNWSPQKSLDDMDRAGVATSIVSPTTPQVGFLPKEDAARIARESNEYARKLATEHPGRFGVFAMLPMPYVDECLKEIAYAFDVLKVDGIGMMTSYGDKWLGYPEFAPVFDELNRRKATVYTHPTNANCCVNLVQGIPESTVEFGADTTRSIASLIFSGASQRYKDVNFIFSHGGGVLTAVAERFEIQMTSTPPYMDKFTRETVDAELRRFYYDTAQISNAVTIGALTKLVPISQIVFGSDYPYRTAADHVKGLATAFSGDDLKAVDRENALRILPQLKRA